MTQPDLITPSRSAIEIDQAHKAVRLARTPLEQAIALKYLEIVVAKIRARQP